MTTLPPPIPATGHTANLDIETLRWAEDTLTAMIPKTRWASDARWLKIAVEKFRKVREALEE